MACTSKIRLPKITSRRNSPWLVKARDDPVLLFGATIPWHIFYPPRFLLKKKKKNPNRSGWLGAPLSRKKKQRQKNSKYWTKHLRHPRGWEGKFRNRQEQTFVFSGIQKTCYESIHGIKAEKATLCIGNTERSCIILETRTSHSTSNSSGVKIVQLTMSFRSSFQDNHRGYSIWRICSRAVSRKPAFLHFPHLSEDTADCTRQLG